MAERRMGIIGILLCLCLLLPCYASAITTADAAEPISLDTECTLTLTYGYDSAAFADVSVKLYQIADVSADCHYTLTPSFASTGLVVNGVQSNAEWNIIRTTLEVAILTNKTHEDALAVTNQTGQVCFEKLKPGLYLAVPGSVVWESQTCVFASALVALPGLDTDGIWQYRVAAKAKAEILPPIQPDEVIQYKVLKLWKGDGSGSSRPQSIEVEIYRDGKIHELVTLSDKNQWSYSWTAKNDGAQWTVTEPKVPSGYKMTLESRSGTFVLTNTKIQSDTSHAYVPKTGDTFNIQLYLTMMYVSGFLLILLGSTGKRKRV